MRKFVRIALGLLIVAAPLPIGGNRPWIFLLFASFVLVIAVLAMMDALARPRLGRRLGTMMLLGVLAGGWLVLLALQLSGGLRFSSGLGAVEEQAAGGLLEVLDGWSSLVPLSLDPSATSLELAYSTMLFAIFFVAVYAVRIPDHAQLLAGFVILSVIVQAVIGASEYFSGFDYPAMSRLGDKPINGTFINRNHFSGYLAIGAALLIGLLADSLTEYRRYAVEGSRNLAIRLLDLFAGKQVAFLGAALVFVTLIGISGSRGAFIALALAVIVGLVVLSATASEEASGARRFRTFGLFITVITVIFAAALVNSTVYERATRIMEVGLEDGRLKEWRISAKTIVDRFDTGHGAGAFTDAFAIHRDGSLGRNSTFDHAHNQYLEIMVETGLVGFTILGALVVTILVITLKNCAHPRSRRTRRTATGILFALVVILAHALVEFNLEIPAIGMTFYLLAGCSVALYTWVPRSMSHEDDDSA